MKKILFLMLSLFLMGGVNSYATKLYATYGTPAGNGSWDSETKTYSWTGNTNNLMSIFTFSSGELRNFNSIHFTTSDLSAGGIYRLYFHGPNKEIVFYSDGGKDITFADRSELKDVDLSTVTGISFGGASGTGSIKITATPYIEKPTEFTFNDAGKAYLYPSDLTASAWGLDSYDPETGIVTKSTSGYGNISFSFGVAGYDFSNITNIEISIDGDYDDIRDYAYITDLNNHTQYISATGGSLSLNPEIIDSNIKEWSLGLNSKTGSMKINYICFTSNVLNSCLGEESSMRSLPIYHWDGSAWQTTGYTPSYRVNESTSAAYYGVDWNGENCQNYSDVEGYKAIRIYSAKGNIPRAMFFNSDASGQQSFNFVWNDKGGYYELLLSSVYESVNNYKLISVRPQSGSTSSIEGIYIIENSPIYDYKISGTGLVTSKVTAALADATATSYDATGVTGTDVDLTSVANLNALFKANSGALANASNVIVGSTCASLELTDGNYSFGAPADFTATEVSYNRLFTVDQPSTVCLPFALTAEEAATAGTFYELTDYSAETLTFTEVDGATEAYIPYLFKAEKANPFSGYSDKAIGATPANLSVSVNEGAAVMTGTMARQSVNGKYGWNSANGEFSIATSDEVTIDPFRAYITINGGGAARIAARFVKDSVTGINEVSKTQNILNPDGKFIKNGKIVIVKNGVKFNAAGAQVK